MSRKESEVLLEQFQRFCEENPLRFDPEQLDRIACDIREPRNGIVFDEYVEFILWTKGLKSRQEYFADLIERIFSR